MKLFIDKQLKIKDNKKELLAEFCIFCAKELPIEGLFEVLVTSNRGRHNINTTAAYLVGENNLELMSHHPLEHL